MVNEERFIKSYGRMFTSHGKKGKTLIINSITKVKLCPLKDDYG